MAHDPNIELWSVRKSNDTFVYLLPKDGNIPARLRLSIGQLIGAVDIPLEQVEALISKIKEAAADLTEALERR